MYMLSITDLQRIAKTRHRLTRHESMARTQLIRHLRGLWAQARMLDDPSAVAIVCAQVDDALKRLGAEPEGIRRDRWRNRANESLTTEQIVEWQEAEGHALYEEWLVHG